MAGLRVRWVSVVAVVGVAVGGLATAPPSEAGPPPDAGPDLPFEVERVGEARDVRDLDGLGSPEGAAPVRELEEADQLGDFSNPPLRGEALAKAEYELAADLAAGRAVKDDSFDPEVSERVEAGTTPQAEVYNNANGTRTSVLSAGPERFRDETGAWVDYDLRLERSQDGSFGAAASDLDVSVPADPAAAGLVVTRRGEEQVVFGVPPVVGSLTGPPVPGADVLSPNGHVAVTGEGGVSAAVTLTSSGFEQQVAFPARDQLVEDGYELAVELPAGWSARQGGEGTNRVEFVDSAGELAATFGSGVAWDASGGSLATAEMADAVVELSGTSEGSASVRVRVDARWLDAAVFPVTIDPTFSYTITTDSTYADTYAQSNLGTAQENAQLVAAGRSTGGVWAGTYLRFPLPGAVSGAPTPPDPLAGVVSAELKMRVYSYAACNAAPLYVQSIAGSWTPSTMTYSSGRPTEYEPWPTASAVVQNTGCTEAWYSFFPRLSLQHQYDGEVGNWGLMVTPWVDGTADSHRVARSAEYASNAAELVVTYEWRPPTPAVVGPADEATVTTTRPTLSVGAVTDNDPADTVKYWYRVWTNPDWAGVGQVVNSGWVTSPTWTPPAEYLTDGGTYYWDVTASDTETVPSASTPIRSFSIDTQLGAGGLSDGAGPVGVSLATGNGMLSLDGPGGVSLAYNSTDAPPTGLTGSYYQDLNTNQLFDDPLKVSRLDSTVGFHWLWGTSPDGSMTQDDFLVRWEGTVTVPETGTWDFGTPLDDRARIWVNGTQVLDKWTAGQASTTTVWGSGIALTAGTEYTIKVEFQESTISGLVNLQAKLPSSSTYSAALDVPTSWLLPKERVPQQAPPGWWASVDAGGTPYTAVVATNDTAVVMSGDAAVLDFKRSGSGFAPPEGSEATLSQDADGRYMLVEEGSRYVFNPDGTLALSQASVEDAAQVPKYTYTSIASGGKTYPRVVSVTDPDTTRSVTYTWSGGGGSCPSAAGYSAPPVGMVCQAVDWDGATTSVLYDSSGRIARFIADPDPGAANDESVTDLGYDSCGRVTKLRDPLAAETVAAGFRTDDDTTRWLIAYTPGSCTPGEWIWDDDIASVTAPEPTAGAARPQTSWTYGTGQADTHVAGLAEALGYARRVTFDDQGQLLTDTDATGKTTTYTYDTQGRAVATVDPAGLKTTTVYNARDLVSDEWGPAPSSWWSPGGVGAPNGGYPSQTPHVTHGYDEGVTSLAAAWFNTETVSPDTSTAATGAQRETTLATGVGGTGGTIDKTWSGGAKPPGVVDVSTMSGELTGNITFGTAGTYKLKLSRHQRVRLWIDDREVITAWTDTNLDTVSYSLTTTAANEVHRIRIQLANTNDTTATIKLWWDLPGGFTTWVVVPGSALSPDYGLETSTTDPDDQVSAVGYSDTASNVGPHHGAPVTTTRDPAGLALVDTTVYRDPTTGDLTQTGRQLPTGTTSQVTYTDYGDTETRDNPCTVPNDPVSQAGAPKLRTDADPDGTGGTAPITHETVYDNHGRTVAERTNSDPWTCTTYDTRSRPTQIDYPVYGGAPARTVTYSWAFFGHPLISAVADPAGAIYTITDLLGRVVTYIDVWGSTTQITYDQAGREASNTSPAGAFTKTYDDAGRLTTLTLGGNTLATVGYDTAGRPNLVVYPAGTGTAGNGTLGLFAYDAVTGAPTSMGWIGAGFSTISSDAVTRTKSGRIIDQTIDGVDPHVGDNYGYDAAGRLTTAWVPGAAYTYTYAPTGGCGLATTAGQNTNRTSTTTNGGTPTTYCYDHADRLTSSSDTAVGTINYDTHGNSTAIFGETHTYDATNRHLSTTKGATTVTYTRDATDRIIERKLNGTTTARYSYTASSDAPALTLDTTGTVLDKTITLPGGALLTTTGATQTWGYPNLHGDLVATANSSGVKQGITATYDPYGNLVTGPLPNNSTGNYDYTWLGQHQRPLEHETGLEPIVEMGARQYSLRLGRFLETDPIEGGSCNGYEYGCGDSINNADLSGNRLELLIRTINPWSKTKRDFFSVWLGACAAFVYGFCYDHIGYQDRTNYYYFWDTASKRVFKFVQYQKRSVYKVSVGCGIWAFAKPCGPSRIRHDSLRGATFVFRSQKLHAKPYRLIDIWFKLIGVG